MNIAVLGPTGVGKSTFIQCALELEKTIASSFSSKKVSLEGSISVVLLVELNVNDVGVVNNSVRWPDNVEDHVLPLIDGALVINDIMDLSSFDTLPKLLSESHSFDSFKQKCRLGMGLSVSR